MIFLPHYMWAENNKIGTSCYKTMRDDSRNESMSREFDANLAFNLPNDERNSNG